MQLRMAQPLTMQSIEKDVLTTLIELQTPDGSWLLDEQLARCLSCSLKQMKEEIPESCKLIIYSGPTDASLCLDNSLFLCWLDSAIVQNSLIYKVNANRKFGQDFNFTEINLLLDAFLREFTIGNLIFNLIFILISEMKDVFFQRKITINVSQFTSLLTCRNWICFDLHHHSPYSKVIWFRLLFSNAVYSTDKRRTRHYERSPAK